MTTYFTGLLKGSSISKITEYANKTGHTLANIHTSLMIHMYMHTHSHAHTSMCDFMQLNMRVAGLIFLVM